MVQIVEKLESENRYGKDSYQEILRIGLFLSIWRVSGIVVRD